MTALLLYTLLLCALLGVAAGLVWHYRARSRRWAAEDDAYQPILPPAPPALPIGGLPLVPSDVVPEGSSYITNGPHGRMLVVNPADLARIKAAGRPRPLPGPRWPNTAATAAAAGEAWGTSSAYRPPLTDDEGGRRGD